MVKRHECDTLTCVAKRRHRTALWRIDSEYYCNPCFEKWMEKNDLVDHVVIRLSDRDEDFRENSIPRHRPSKKALAISGTAA